MAREKPGRARRAECAARHSRRKSAASPAARSCRLQVRFERLNRHLERRLRTFAPQFAAVEHDGVEPLRILALADGDGVGKDVTAAQRLDYADAVAGVTRQARMRFRVDVFGAHAIAGFKPRWLLRLTRERAAR